MSIKKIRSFFYRNRVSLLSMPLLTFLITIIVTGYFLDRYVQTQLAEKASLSKKLSSAQSEFTKLKNQDQIKRNNDLQEQIKNIHDTYSQAKTDYEKLLDLKTQVKDTKALDALYAETLQFLSVKNYASASADLTQLEDTIKKEQAKIASSFTIPSSAKESNTPPNSGFSQQTVTTDTGSFLVSLVAADLNSTRVIVDTASDSDCKNDCPALPLADYVSRNGAFAGINGTFFCPPEYPSCAGKTNSFDTLLMNKNKHYFNSDNNVYSTVPVIYFTGTTMGVRRQSLDWGRDTGVDSVIANQPLYVVDGNNAYGGSSDPKITNKGVRCFVGNKGSTAYIGIVYNASAEDAAKVLTALKLDNALGLDQGGSTALWFGGYKAGPGRNLPNAVLFVHK